MSKERKMVSVEFVRDTTPTECSKPFKAGDKAKLTETGLKRWLKNGAVKVVDGASAEKK